MSFDEFMNIVKSSTAPPNDFFSQLTESIEEMIKSDDTFFPVFLPNDKYTITLMGDLNFVFLTDCVEDALEQFSQYYNSIRELTVKYICFVMSKSTTTNGFSNTITPMDMGVLDDWFDKNTTRVGQAQFLRYMLQDDKLKSYAEDASTWAVTIASKIGTDDFLTALLVECQTIGSDLPAMVLLLSLKALDRGGDNFTKVLNVWNQNAQWNLVEGYDSYPWLDSVKSTLELNSDIYNSVNQAVTDACKPTIETMGPSDITNVSGMRLLGKGITIPSAAVQRWVDSDEGPKAYNLRSNESGPPTTATG